VGGGGVGEGWEEGGRGWGGGGGEGELSGGVGGGGRGEGGGGEVGGVGGGEGGGLGRRGVFYLVAVLSVHTRGRHPFTRKKSCQVQGGRTQLNGMVVPICSFRSLKKRTIKRFSHFARI